MLPTADIRNILDLNEFSWPLSAMDTDCQFDFDMPFTLEQTDISTGASSTSLVDSDTVLRRALLGGDLNLADGSPAHTGCVAFGMDRLAVAMFATHGADLDAWPAGVREALQFG